MSTSKRASIRSNSPLDDLFRPSAPKEPEAATPPVASAPLQEDEEPEQVSHQTSIMLFDAQLDWLAEKCIEARKGGGKRIRKAVLIRALIDLARHAPVDLRGVQSDEEVRERLEQAIKHK